MRFFSLVAASFLLLAGCGGASDATNASAAATPVKAVVAPTGTNWSDSVEKTAEGGHRMGNPNAPIKLIEYGSRTCPTCARFDVEGMAPLKANYVASGKVSYEFREFPVHGALDLGPILLGNCVGPDAFFPILDQMYLNQPTLLAKEQEVAAEVQAMGNLTPAQLATAFAEKFGYIDFMKQRGVPETAARACLTDPAAIAAIDKNTQAATSQFRVSGTPTFVLNGNVLNVEPSWAGVEAALKAAGA